MPSPLFGWDLVIESVQSEIKSNDDILLCFVHLVLISNEFRCIGLGESKVLEGNEKKSEALPAGWSESYAIRYLHKGCLYLLKATKMPDAVLINLVRVEERASSAIQFNSDLVASRTGSLTSMLPKYSDMMQQIKTDLIGKLETSKKKQDSSSQTAPVPASSTSSSSRRDRPPTSMPQVMNPRRSEPESVGVGEYDLNPFGRNPLRIPGPTAGGGMLFEPPGSGRFPQGPEFGMPPGAVPPGARFDPFRPPDVDRQPRRPPNRPDNDEFMPPGYDDMFM